MEYWHGACHQDPARLTDSDRGFSGDKYRQVASSFFFKCSSGIVSIDTQNGSGLSLNDWQLAPEVVLGSRSYTNSSYSSNSSFDNIAGKHDDSSSDSINGDGSSQEQEEQEVAAAAKTFATTLLPLCFVAVTCPSTTEPQPQSLYSHH